VAPKQTPSPPKSPQEVKERDLLEKIIARDRTHKQWFKHGLCFLLLLLLILASLFRGTKSVDSIIGITTCSAWDWVVLVAFVIISALVTFASIRSARSEQALKVKY
jgi:hypothetical protein